MGLENARSRKWQLTINNPLDQGFDHSVIRDKLSQMKSLVYWCMCDEEGDECETLHTHVFFCLSHACTASRLQNLFPNCHREIVHGKSAENRAYILKDGEKFNEYLKNNSEAKVAIDNLYDCVNNIHSHLISGPDKNSFDKLIEDLEEIEEIIGINLTNKEIADITRKEIE